MFLHLLHQDIGLDFLFGNSTDELNAFFAVLDPTSRDAIAVQIVRFINGKMLNQCRREQFYIEIGEKKLMEFAGWLGQYLESHGKFDKGAADLVCSSIQGIIDEMMEITIADLDSVGMKPLTTLNVMQLPGHDVFCPTKSRFQKNIPKDLGTESRWVFLGAAERLVLAMLGPSDELVAHRVELATAVLHCTKLMDKWVRWFEPPSDEDTPLQITAEAMQMVLRDMRYYFKEFHDKDTRRKLVDLTGGNVTAAFASKVGVKSPAKSPAAKRRRDDEDDDKEDFESYLFGSKKHPGGRKRG